MKKVFLKYNHISNLDDYYNQCIQDIGDFYQQLPYNHDYLILETEDLDDAFSNKIPTDTEWVVVVQAGHCTLDRGLYDDCIQHCIDSNASLMGHILNFDDQYPHLHPQLIIINYQSWKNCGSPQLNYDSQPSEFISVSYSSSKETFHDQYTPYWLAPTSPIKEYFVQEMQVGAYFIKSLLEKGLTVYNIPQEQRDKKFHLYPDQCWREFNRFFLQGEYHGTNSSQQYYSSLMKHLADQAPKQYYFLNTEPLTKINANQSITHYAGVASGIKLFCTMIKNKFDSNTSVTIFDFSAVALRFQKYLIDYWDGDFDNYQVTCKDFEKWNADHYPCVPSGPWEDNYKYILDQLQISKHQFQEYWNLYKKLDHKFIDINLYNFDDQQILVDLCIPHNQSYIWVSNAFYMEYSLVQYGKERLKSFRQSLLELIEKSEANIILDSNDFWSQGLITFNN